MTRGAGRGVAAARAGVVAAVAAGDDVAAADGGEDGDGAAAARGRRGTRCWRGGCRWSRARRERCQRGQRGGTRDRGCRRGRRDRPKGGRCRGGGPGLSPCSGHRECAQADRCRCHGRLEYADANRGRRRFRRLRFDRGHGRQTGTARTGSPAAGRRRLGRRRLGRRVTHPARRGRSRLPRSTTNANAKLALAIRMRTEARIARGSVRARVTSAVTPECVLGAGSTVVLQAQDRRLVRESSTFSRLSATNARCYCAAPDRPNGRSAAQTTGPITRTGTRRWPCCTRLRRPTSARRDWRHSASAAAPIDGSIQLDVSGERISDVECLFPDRRLPIPLGDLDSATPICNGCSRRAHLPPRRGLISARQPRWRSRDPAGCADRCASPSRGSGARPASNRGPAIRGSGRSAAGRVPLNHGWTQWAA